MAIELPNLESEPLRLDLVQPRGFCHYYGLMHDPDALIAFKFDPKNFSCPLFSTEWDCCSVANYPQRFGIAPGSYNNSVLLDDPAVLEKYMVLEYYMAPDDCPLKEAATHV